MRLIPNVIQKYVYWYVSSLIRVLLHFCEWACLISMEKLEMWHVWFSIYLFAEWVQTRNHFVCPSSYLSDGKREYFAYLWGSHYLLEPSLICILSNHTTPKYHLSQLCQMSPEIKISSVRVLHAHENWVILGKQW